jgi:hypothetical protein
VAASAGVAGTAMLAVMASSAVSVRRIIRRA